MKFSPQKFYHKKSLERRPPMEREKNGLYNKWVSSFRNILLLYLLFFPLFAGAEEPAPQGQRETTPPNENTETTSGTLPFSPPLNQTPSSTPYIGGAGYFLTGFQIFPLSPYRDAFQNSGIPEPSFQGIVIGGGGRFRYNRFLVGGSGGGILGEKTENLTYQSETGGGYGFLDGGYTVWESEQWALFPFFGVGGVSLSHRIVSRSRPENWNALLRNPSTETTITISTFLLRLGAGVEFFLPSQKEGFGLIGLEGGYSFSPFSTAPRSGGKKLDGAPSLTFNGYYLLLRLGGGGGGNR
jgi:hypothetical protein